MVHNLLRVQHKWALLTRLLRREGADARTLGRIYVALVQVVFLYELEMWVMTSHIGRALGGFQQRVACSLMAQKPQRGFDGRWVYPLIAEATEEAGLQEVETYISLHQNTVAQFFETRPIMDLCLAEDSRPRSQIFNRWWDQEGFDLEWMRTADQEA